MQGDICDRPEKNQRPPEWGDMGGLDEEGLGPGSEPLKPNDSPDGGSWSGSNNLSGDLGSEQTISSD